MPVEVHRPFPGTALIIHETGSVLVGVPPDGFKAVKQYTTEKELPFPRVLVSPPKMLVAGQPQFAPEFFLYDFMFVYGAAFKPELADERLALVVPSSQIDNAVTALRMTLVGPSREEMAGYVDSQGARHMPEATSEMLAMVSDRMAIKRGDKVLAVTDMADIIPFDDDPVELLGGAIVIARTSDGEVEARVGSERAILDLNVTQPVQPFATLDIPIEPLVPQKFGVQVLGCRSGFDLSGPTTGFLFWVNGRGVLFDGPPGTDWLLKSQGFSYDDIDVMVLSHCHEDHMGSFVEAILSPHRPRIYTAEPIYQSALVKLANYFGQSIEAVSKLFDYRRITPGVPVEELGATFDFFYTVHAIPTLGMTVSMKSIGGTKHAITISGDNLHLDGLEQFREAGAVTEDTYSSMRHLVPASKVDKHLFFADVGEAIIHGHPKDWAENPNDVIYYHCPDNEHVQSFGKPVATPGKVHTMIESGTIHPVTPARLLKALGKLELEPEWLAAFLNAGHMESRAPGDNLSDSESHIAVLISGRGINAGADLAPGACIAPSSGHDDAPKAATAAEVFIIPTPLYKSFQNEVGRKQPS